MGFIKMKHWLPFFNRYLYIDTINEDIDQIISDNISNAIFTFHDKKEYTNPNNNLKVCFLLIPKWDQKLFETIIFPALYNKLAITIGATFTNQWENFISNLIKVN